MYEQNPKETGIPYSSNAENYVLEQYAKLPQFVTKHKSQVIEVSGSEEELWRFLSSEVGQIKYAYSPLDRNCFAFAEDVLTSLNATVDTHYVSRLKQAFDLHLRPPDIEAKASQLIDLELGVHQAGTKARLYFKTNARRGNLLVYIDPDAELLGVLIQLAAYLSHKNEDDIIPLLTAIDRDGNLFPALRVSLRDISKNEERLKQLDEQVNKWYNITMTAKSIFSLTQQKSKVSQSNYDFAGTVIFTALSSAVWTEILQENLLLPLFQTFGEDLAAVKLGNLHWYHEVKCSTLGNQLLVTACELNSQFIMFFDQCTKWYSWVVPLLMLLVSEVCVKKGFYWMFVFDVVSFAHFDWRIAVGFIMLGAVIYSRYSSKRFPRSPLIVGHLTVLMQVYLLIVSLCTGYLYFSLSSDDAKKIKQAATLLEELNLLLPECAQFHTYAWLLKPIAAPLRLFLISFTVFDWKVKIVCVALFYQTLFFEFCALTHHVGLPKDELQRWQYFTKVINQGGVQRWLVLVGVSALFDSIVQSQGYFSYCVVILFMAVVWCLIRPKTVFYKMKVG